VKHVPIRTCVGCRQRRPQRELVRLVRRPDGVVVRDADGGTPGRGAYVCVEVVCLERALKGGRLAQTLRGRCRLDAELERAVHEAGTPPMTFAHWR
jgi:predicted RNA-binding protein YlxR (DUF448 family)